MLKAVARTLVGGKAFEFRIRLGPPVRAEGIKEERDYKDITELVRHAVRNLAGGVETVETKQ